MVEKEEWVQPVEKRGVSYIPGVITTMLTFQVLFCLFCGSVQKRIHIEH